MTMYVIMGATGHVGSAVADALLSRGQPVTIIARARDDAEAWRSKGAKTAIADVEDPGALREAFRHGSRAFLLNPPADVKGETDTTELRTVANILAALEGSDLEKVVAESTAGAMPGKGIGDSSVLWEFEQGLSGQPIPAAINRAAFYMSNWDAQLEGVKKTGQLQTMYPANFALPMVAPHDLGIVAADRLMAPVSDTEMLYIEGPSRYTSEDVARAFAEALNRPVETVTTSPDQLRATYKKLGFSDAAAEAYARMTEETLKSDFDFGNEVIRGNITLQRYIRALVANANA